VDSSSGAPGRKCRPRGIEAKSRRARRPPGSPPPAVQTMLQPFKTSLAIDRLAIQHHALPPWPTAECLARQWPPPEHQIQVGPRGQARAAHRARRRPQAEPAGSRQPGRGQASVANTSAGGRRPRPGPMHPAHSTPEWSDPWAAGGCASRWDCHWVDRFPGLFRVSANMVWDHLQCDPRIFSDQPKGSMFR